MSMTRPRGCARDAGDSSTGAVSLRLELPAPTTTTTTVATTTTTATTATTTAAATTTSRVPYQEPRPPPGGLRWACLHDGSGKRGSMDREGWKNVALTLLRPVSRTSPRLIFPRDSAEPTRSGSKRRKSKRRVFHASAIEGVTVTLPFYFLSKGDKSTTARGGTLVS